MVGRVSVAPVREVAAGQPVTEVAGRYGVTRQTLQGWNAATSARAFVVVRDAQVDVLDADNGAGPVLHIRFQECDEDGDAGSIREGRWWLTYFNGRRYQED